MNVYVEQTLLAPSVTFWGAAQGVSGSMHLIRAGGQKLLLDCGRSPSQRDSRRRAASFPFLPRDISAVILTHAHMDHCGNLPHLVRQGFHGPIYCTPATRDLVAVMLGDKAIKQEDDARILRLSDRDNSNADEIEALVSREDVAQTLRLCVPVSYEETHEVTPEVSLRFVDAGHLLGSAMAALTIRSDDREQRITFTGDLGRVGMPLLRDPAPVPEAELLICECTYGGRVHDSLANVTAQLIDAVKRTIARGGKVLIPAFSLGRTQLVVSCLRDAMERGLIPRLPLFVDSPLAAQVSDVYRRHLECLNGETALRLQQGHDPFNGELVRYVRTSDESKDLASRSEPCVIIASGAMCDGGRIMSHLRQNLDDPRCTIILVSYQSPETVGARLKEPKPTVRFHGRDWNVWAEVVDLNGFSGHADREDFLRLLGPLADRVKKVCLVHGETEQARALAEALRQRGFGDVSIPQTGETINLE
jgi:metallo-beta-lactamase family protein